MTLVSAHWHVEIRNCYCESNHAADYLAKVRIEFNSPFEVFDDPPPLIMHIVFEDVSGVVK